MKKTYREVVSSDINNKKDEVWENDNAIVYIGYRQMCIRFKADCTEMSINPNDIFTLLKKEYDFNEAYKAYKEGKEIESLKTNGKHKIINNGNKSRNIFTDEWEKCYGFGIDEIDGKWHIND